MLFHLVSWLVLFVSGSTIGNTILLVTEDSIFTRLGDRIIASTWLGLLAMGSALLGLSVFAPLTPALGFGVIVMLSGIGIVIQIASRRARPIIPRLGANAWLGISLLSGIVALNSTRMVEAYDTGLYHYQFVRWLSQYGTVRGFALLHERFGSSSSWFALAALFDFGLFQRRTAGLMGGLTILLCLSQFLLVLKRVLSCNAHLPDWFLLGGYGLIIPICLAWSFEVSLSPDLPAWVLVLLTGWLMLVCGEETVNQKLEKHFRGGMVIPLVLALGSLTVKLSSAPMVLIAAIFYLRSSSQKWMARLFSVIAAGVIAVPMLLANFVSSACPLYPNSTTCLDFPWGVGKAAARQCARDVTEWARWSGPTPPDATAWNWILPWLHHLDKSLLVLFCALCLSWFVVVRQWGKNRSLIYVFSGAIAGLLFIFVTAPNPRFGAGYLALCPALCLAGVGPTGPQEIRDKTGRAVSSARILYATSLILVLYGTVRELKIERSIKRLQPGAMRIYSLAPRLLEPPPLAHLSGDSVFVSNRRVNALGKLELSFQHYHGIDYRLTVNGGDQCWGATIPCLPTPLEGDIYLRRPSEGIRGGFSRFSDFR